jgi:hypothetical protein
MRATGLYQAVGERRFYANAEMALARIYARIENIGDDDPLKQQSA